MTDKSIIVVGDTFPTYTNTHFFASGDVESLFGEKICNMFANADLTICNLEGALTDNPERCNKIGPVIIAPTNTVEAYKRLGVDCCMLANNHITDGGHQGVVDTIRTLDNANIKHIGAGINENEIERSLVYDLGNIKIGLYNVCELMYNRPAHNKGGAWLYDEYIVCKEIADLKSRCDYLIVIYHGGIERFRYPSPENRKRFHRMADNGADMILSQHTHCIGCEEWYKGAYLLYGQGNFLFRNLRPGQTDEAIIIEIKVSNGKPSVFKHLVKCVEDKFVRYNERQDFIEFIQRSMDIKNDGFVFQQFQQFCRNNLWKFLTPCKSPSLPMRLIRKLFLNYYNNTLLFKTFSLRHLMVILLFLRSEQKREEAIVGMEDLLDDVLNNKVGVDWYEP